MNRIDSIPEADANKAQNKTKLKEFYNLYCFYKSNAEQYREKDEFFHLSTLNEFVKFRLHSGIDLCCFNVGYVTYQMMGVSPKAGVNKFEESQKILAETCLLLNQLADEVDFQFKDLGDAIDVDNQFLRMNVGKETYKLIPNITARYHGNVQDLTFDYFFKDFKHSPENMVPLDYMMQVTGLLCQTECIIRYCETVNRPKLYKSYQLYSYRMRAAADLLAYMPEMINLYKAYLEKNHE